MAHVLKRTTKEYRTSVNDPDFSVVDWIINPDVSAVAGQPTKYWLINGDVVTLMDQSARDVIDATELEAQKDSVSDEFDATMTVLRAFGEVIVDEFNLRADKINAILDAVDGATSLATFKTAVGAINDYPQRTLAQLKTAVRNKL